MKRVLTALLVALALLASDNRFAFADDKIVMFSSLTTSGTFGCPNADGTVGPCDLSGYRMASFQVTSVSGSIATVDFKCRNTPSDPYATVFTITNPSSTELGYTGSPVSGQCQAVVTWTSGTLNGTLTRSK